jgi:hypothetical protein
MTLIMEKIEQSFLGMWLIHYFTVITSSLTPSHIKGSAFQEWNHL